MNMTLITYRTNNCSHNSFVVVPTSFYSDLVQWLTLSECVRVIATTHNVDHDLLIPQEWPNYQTCLDHVKISDLSQCRFRLILSA